MSVYKKRWVKQRMIQVQEWEATHGEVKHFEFNTVGGIGPTGCGKTLAMTWILKNFAAQGIPIFTNYHTKIEGGTYVQDPMELLTCQGIIGCDELSKYANARLSQDARTIFFSELASEARKTTASLYYTDQRFKNCDIKIRNNTDYILFPDYNKPLHWCIVYAFEGLNYETPLDVFEFDCLPIYELFDTKEKVKSVYTTQTKEKYADLLLKRLSKEEIANILEEARGEGLQHVMREKDEQKAILEEDFGVDFSTKPIFESPVVDNSGQIIRRAHK